MIKLTPREHRLALIAAAVLAGCLITSRALKPAAQRLETLKRVIPQNQQILQDMSQKSTQLARLQTQIDRLSLTLDTREEHDSLLARISEQIKEDNLTDNELSIKQDTRPLDAAYAQTVVTIELEKINLQQLVNFLEKAKSKNPTANLMSLNITNTPPLLLNTTIQFNTLHQIPPPS